jgi:hypothetical protein
MAIPFMKLIALYGTYRLIVNENDRRWVAGKLRGGVDKLRGGVARVRGRLSTETVVETSTEAPVETVIEAPVETVIEAPVDDTTARFRLVETDPTFEGPCHLVYAGDWWGPRFKSAQSPRGYSSVADAQRRIAQLEAYQAKHGIAVGGFQIVAR